MGRYWNVRVLERRFSLINSSHRYSTQPNYRSTPNYPTKTKARVSLSLFVALRLFSRADSRSGVHITRFSQKSKMCWISTIWRKMCWISFFLEDLSHSSFSPFWNWASQGISYAYLKSFCFTTENWQKTACSSTVTLNIHTKFGRPTWCKSHNPSHDTVFTWVVTPRGYRGEHLWRSNKKRYKIQTLTQFVRAYQLHISRLNVKKNED